MSAAKMVADSTQAEPTDPVDGKKKKRKVKKTGKKVSLPEDEDSDLDLKKDLHPIGHYIKNRSKMVGEMFKTVRGASLQRALPDLLKSIPLEELRQLCLEQLEVMSKKRIRRILAGEESANISSSGTEDDTTDEEMEAAFVDGDKEKDDTSTAPVTEAHPADSTSVHQELPSKPEEPQSLRKPEEPQSLRKPEEPPTTGFVSTFQQVEVKQEPPDSAEEEDMDQSGNDHRDDDYPPDNDSLPDDDYDDDEDDEDEEEEEEEDIEANYTSGSEDGELVRREVQVKVNEEVSSEQTVQVKQEPTSDTEVAAANPEGSSGAELQPTQKDVDDADDNNRDDEEEEEEDDDDEDDDDDEEDQEGTSVEDEGGNMVLPSIMMDQMELLELEMRARAIKAMLSSQEGEDG